MDKKGILWRRLDQPGHDAARLLFQDPRWHLEGEGAGVSCAWLRFPDFTFEVLEQAYIHVEPQAYRYEAFSGEFVKNLTVNDVGLVIRYQDLWEVEASTF